MVIKALAAVKVLAALAASVLLATAAFYFGKNAAPCPAPAPVYRPMQPLPVDGAKSDSGKKILIPVIPVQPPLPPLKNKRGDWDMPSVESGRLAVRVRGRMPVARQVNIRSRSRFEGTRYFERIPYTGNRARGASSRPGSRSRFEGARYFERLPYTGNRGSGGQTAEVATSTGSSHQYNDDDWGSGGSSRTGTRIQRQPSRTYGILSGGGPSTWRP